MTAGEFFDRVIADLRKSFSEREGKIDFDEVEYTVRLEEALNVIEAEIRRL